MANISSRNQWIFDKAKNILLDKDELIKAQIFQMLNKTTTMFKYNGLPETITVKDLETINQVGGYSIWKEVDGKLYCFSGGFGGEPNAYYLPTLAIVANPWLKYSASLEIDKDCVVMLNDNYYQGLMPLFSKYAHLLVDAELSLKYSIINSRIPAMVQADNDNTYDSAKQFFDTISKGTDFGVVLTKEMFEGLKTFSYNQQGVIKDLIESIQYIKGSWYNELGLNAQFNMKREAINESEAMLNEDILRPTIDIMLECRKIGLDKVNKMFGTEITVELDSVWLQNRKEEQIQMDIFENEAETEKDVDTEIETETEVEKDESGENDES